MLTRSAPLTTSLLYASRTAADKRKSFYEDVVQIGKREDSGYGTEDFELVANCLKKYMAGFHTNPESTT